MTMIYVLLVAHFVADFIAQSDWMAVNKSKRWDALTVHVTVYTGVVSAFLFAYYQMTEWPGIGPMWFLAATFGTHFVQDAITSRINSRLWQANERHWFFVGIGADQLLHYVILFVTAGWWLR